MLIVQANHCLFINQYSICRNIFIYYTSCADNTVLSNCYPF